MHKTFLHTALVCLFAFLGGVASEQFMHSANSCAQNTISDVGGRAIANTAQVYNDNSGRRRIDIDGQSGPVQDFYGANGSLRLQLGTYNGVERPGTDAGLPLVALSDKLGRLRMLFRLTPGENQSPVMVMKDSAGKDRIVMGTSLNGENEDPFLAYIDKSGNKHMVFGSF